MPQNPINSPIQGGSAYTAVPAQTARSGNYTVSAADVANGYTQPIEVLWPNTFPDTNYTVAVSVQQIKGIKAPNDIVNAAQFTVLMGGLPSGQPGAGSEGIVVVLSLHDNATAGDILVVHAVGFHD